MRVRYHSALRTITGVSEEPWPDSEQTLRALCAALGQKYGAAFSGWLSLEERSAPAAIMLINGSDARALGGVAASLAPDDVIDLFPPLAGG
jgi:molybdopterin converting factor small subunit